MKLSELAAGVNWIHGLIISDEDVTALAIEAVRQYAGFGPVRSLRPTYDDSGAPLDVSGSIAEQIDEETDLSDGEWAIVKPLFKLYVERENARSLEASRGVGVDVYGRDVGTIEADIRQYETQDLPRLAFSFVPESV